MGHRRLKGLWSCILRCLRRSVCPFTVSGHCCGQGSVEVGIKSFSVCLQNKFSVWEQGKGGFAVIVWKLEASYGRFRARVPVACPAAGTVQYLVSRGSQRAGAGQRVLLLQLCLFALGPALPSLTSHFPLSAEVLASRVITSSWAAEEPKPCPVQREKSLPEKLGLLVGCAVRVSLRLAFLQFRATDVAGQGEVSTALLPCWERCPTVRAACQLWEGCLVAGLGR